MLFRKILILFLLIITICVTSCEAATYNKVEENLDMSIADIILIIVSCGIIIITALDVRIALMCALLIYTGIFIVFTYLTEEGFSNFNPYYSGLAMMLCFVILCLGLLITYKKSNTPYYMP